MLTPPLPSGIAIGQYQFSGLQLWTRATAPLGGGLYALLRPDPLRSANYVLISVGEDANLQTMFTRLRLGPLQQLVQEFRAHIYIAWLAMPFTAPQAPGERFLC